VLLSIIDSWKSLKFLFAPIARPLTPHCLHRARPPAVSGQRLVRHLLGVPFFQSLVTTPIFRADAPKKERGDNKHTRTHAAREDFFPPSLSLASPGETQWSVDVSPPYLFASARISLLA